MFAESGYSGARVDEIAERTRTTKRMIYYYFGGKEQLYMAVLENAYRGIREAEQKLRVDHVNPVGGDAPAGRGRPSTTTSPTGAFIRLVSIENIHRGEFIRQLRDCADLSQPATSLLGRHPARGRAPGRSARTSTPSTCTW